jgi:hypothetical protein
MGYGAARLLELWRLGGYTGMELWGYGAMELWELWSYGGCGAVSYGAMELWGCGDMGLG